jgi:hypothetical protein
MKRDILHLSALFSSVALLAVLTACQSVREADDGKGQATEIRIKQQPQSKLVELRSPAEFTVEASVPKPFQRPTHHWFFNGNLIDGEAAGPLGLSNYDTPHLRIDSTSLTNVGLYSYLLEAEDGKGRAHFLHSSVVELMVFTGGHSPMVVYGTPIAGSGGGGTGCPGPYVGYVRYSNVNDPSGGFYFKKGGTAYDPNRRDTKVRYYGVPYSNSKCATNVPTSSYPYTFAIYFRSDMPSGPYPIMLNPK